MAAVSAAALAACSATTDRVPYEGNCPPFELLTTSPSSNASDVPTNTDVTLYYSDFPDPETVNVDSIVLTSSRYRWTGHYNVDLVDKKIRFRPASPLQPNLTYTVTVFKNLGSLQGCTPSRDERRFFRTGSQPGPIPGPATAPFADVLAIFGRSCAGATCHRPPEPSGPGPCTSKAPKDLSLCDAEAYSLLVGAPATEMGRLRRVEPRDSSRSFLIRKLLSGPSGGRAPGTPGARMPAGSDALPPEDIRTIADWIDSGALR